MSASHKGGNSNSSIDRLLSENESLKAKLNELNETFNKTNEELARSCKICDRLESLSKELQKQTEEIKKESASKMSEAECRGNMLAKEVCGNMGLMNSMNVNLSTITDQTMKVRSDKENLVDKISNLKTHYDERDKKLSGELDRANKQLIMTKAELAELRLQIAHEKERTYSEMQKIANSLVSSRQQMKDAKDHELQLRVVIQKYDEKFVALQSELKDTNLSYGSFKEEMEQVGTRTKDLEEETSKWKQRWDENNKELMTVTENNEKLQNQLIKVHNNLVTVTNLYKALDKERDELLKKLGREA